MEVLQKMDKKGVFLTFFALASILVFTLPCKVEITPQKAIAALDGSNVSVTCQANCSSDIIRRLSIHEKNRTNDHFEETALLSNCTPMTPPVEDDGLFITNCFGVVNMDNNGSYIYCFEVISGNHSTAIEVLVQDSLNNVYNNSFNVQKIDTNHLKISWSPVFAYEGLTVYYNITLNETLKTTNNSWIVFDTSGLDLCQFATLNITSFINANNPKLALSNTSRWSTSIEIPPEINNLNYNMMMRKNGSVLFNLKFKFQLTDCDCPGRINNTWLTLESDTYSFYDVAPVVSGENCTGSTKLILPPYARLKAILILKNSVGKTTYESISIDTNPLREIYVTNGTDSSPPSVQCIFTDDLLITNKYSTGCLYYNILGGPVNVPRLPDEPNVTTVIPNTLASYTGLICFVSVPFHEHCREISVHSEKLLNTEKEYSTAVINDISTSVTVTPTSTATQSYITCILSSTTPALATIISENQNFMLIIGGTAGFGAFIGATFGGILVFVCYVCCTKKTMKKSQEQANNAAEPTQQYDHSTNNTNTGVSCTDVRVMENPATDLKGDQTSYHSCTNYDSAFTEGTQDNDDFNVPESIANTEDNDALFKNSTLSRQNPMPSAASKNQATNNESKKSEETHC